VRLLRELDRIVTAHDLAEFRQAIIQLVGRMERNWWTIAFVGRVSCGKSSLLNHLLTTDVLPAGVTPVTAVPIRIVSGGSSAATVSFATGEAGMHPD
jgi:GTPase SAR1 family protein